jgi:probable F420-dependent oxidoreductase
MVTEATQASGEVPGPTDAAAMSSSRDQGASASSHPFRFGVALLGTVGSAATWRARVRHAADLGYDIVHVADHLPTIAPFPSLVAAASVPGPRLGTLALNTGLYRPAVLARDVADTNRLIEGRLELGLGTGHSAADYEAAGLPFGRPGPRVDHVEQTITELRRLVDPMPPLLLAASGRRMLRLAAREADIVGFIVVTPGSEQFIADRIEFLHSAAGDRFDQLELNLSVLSVIFTDGDPDLTMTRQLFPGQSDEQLRANPGVLIGSVSQVAETLLRYREKYRLTYFSVIEPYMKDFAKIIERLR